MGELADAPRAWSPSAGVHGQCGELASDASANFSPKQTADAYLQNAAMTEHPLEGN